jgi:Flp pilus assembly protein TadD
LLVLVAHLPALSSTAKTFDDDDYLFRNPLVKNPSVASGLRFLTEVVRPSTVRGYYQPVSMLSLMIDYALGGRSDNLFPFHRTSLILHLCNTMLIGVLLYQLLHEPWIAAGTALVFGIHPMTVDSVVWLSERKTLLATSFTLWSLLLYLSFVEKRRILAYVGSVVMYILAVMSKPTSLPLPIVMSLLDCWPLRRVSLRTMLEKLPHWAIGLVFGGITYFSQANTGGVVLPDRMGAARALPVFCFDMMFYLRKFVWPTQLSAYYPVPEPLTFANPVVLLSALSAFLLLLLLLVTLRWTGAMLVGATIFIVGTLPTTGIVGFTDVLVANRFVYLPSFGVLLIFGVLLKRICRKCEKGGARLYVLATVLLFIVGAETTCTRQYLSHWANTLSLYRHMVCVAPSAAGLQNDLANEFSARGELDRAIQHYREALCSNPHYWPARANLGSALVRRGEHKQAMRLLVGTVCMIPNYAPAHAALGTALEVNGRMAEAVWHYRRATELAPYSVDSYYNLARLLLARGYACEAMTTLRRAIRLDPEFLPAHGDLAWLLATHPDAALRNPGEAIALAGYVVKRTGHSDPLMLDILAAAYAANGDFAQAAAVAMDAVRLASKRTPELAVRIHGRLRLYQSRRACLDDPAAHKR